MSARLPYAIPEHIVRPPPPSPPSAMQRGNRIHQRQGFLRVVPVRAGQANRERHAPPVADQMSDIRYAMASAIIDHDRRISRAPAQPRATTGGRSEDKGDSETRQSFVAVNRHDEKG
jgi:hypothetical protein